MGPQIDLGTPAGIALALLPELFLTGWALVVMLLIAWRHRTEDDQQLVGHVALAGLVITLALVIALWARDVRPAGLPVTIALDGYRFAASSVFLIGGTLAVLLSLGYLGRERIVAPEYYLLVLLAVLGMMFMGGAQDLIIVFIGLELMSVSVYVLAGINRRSIFAAEAALKYFLLGAFASGFFLYGIALIYGATGTTDLTFIRLQLLQQVGESQVMLGFGVGMLLIGFGFKVAAVPFHMWTPDVYDGAPTPVTAFMAAAVKAAGFVALARILFSALQPVQEMWVDALWWLAVITMIVGNLVALAQRNLKRMLAYSSIGHAGYLLVAVASAGSLGAAALLYYVFVYTLVTVGAFAVLGAIGRGGERSVTVDDLNGLGSKRPWLAFAMTVFMLSLLGFPGTAGFIGKWFILQAAVQADQSGLAVILVGASVVSAGYYLPVIMAMYMRPPESETAHAGAEVRGAARWVVGAMALMLLLFGVWPNRLLDVARHESDTLRPTVAVTVSR